MNYVHSFHQTGTAIVELPQQGVPLYAWGFLVGIAIALLFTLFYLLYDARVVKECECCGLPTAGTKRCAVCEETT